MPRDLSAGQKRIVDRYYQNRDTIAINKLREIVSELYLAEPGKRDRLWKRAETHLKAAGANPAESAKILADKRVEALATLVNRLV